MNAPKPTKSLAGTACRECGEGHFQFIQIDHVEKISNDNPVTVPGVWVNRCDHCGEIDFPRRYPVQYIRNGRWQTKRNPSPGRSWNGFVKTSAWIGRMR